MKKKPKKVLTGYRAYDSLLATGDVPCCLTVRNIDRLKEVVRK